MEDLHAFVREHITFAEADRIFGDDIEKAAEIRVRDADVDSLNKEIQKTAIKAIPEFPEDTETLVHLILLARNFERAGDHIVNIARQVHQIVTGEDLKASS